MDTLGAEDDSGPAVIRLRVGIVGAGIAGLCAAIALRRAGHEVEVFERSHFRQEAGAAITITPNAGRILDAWGFDSKAARGSDRLQAQTVNSITLEPVAHNALEASHPELVHAYRRTDLHNELKHIAKASRGIGSPVKVFLGKDVLSVDCQQSAINFRNASQHKDLIICADGIKSATLASVIGFESPPKHVERAVYRTLINVDKIKDDELVWQTFEKYGWSSIDTPLNLQGTRCDIYPCVNVHTISVAIYHVSKPHERDKPDWSSPATVHDVLQVLEGMHPFFSSLVKHADHFSCYRVGIREPPPVLVNQCTVVIGDAAHAMQPLHAQGACMCVEDAAALQVLFENFGPSDSVQLRLRIFNQLRMPRIAVTMLYSNAMYYQAHREEWMEMIHRHYKGDIPKELAPWTAESQRFFWDYDAFEEARKALQFRRCLTRIPAETFNHFGL